MTVIKTVQALLLFYHLVPLVPITLSWVKQLLLEPVKEVGIAMPFSGLSAFDDPFGRY